jgi:NTP pyrophosphatase (non-canonical NTP hydrolase)
LQKEIDSWIQNTGNGYFDILTNMSVLMEEVGELARVVSRKYGEQVSKEGEILNFEDELADILWVIICIANSKDVNLTKALQANLVKKTKRDVNRFKKSEK